LEVVNDDRIDIGEIGRPLRQSAIPNEISKQPSALWINRFFAEDGDLTWYGDGVADDQIVERLPSADGQERMVSGHFNTPTGLSRHRETGLNATVNPIRNMTPLDLPAGR
jgi:hypothetical protein